MKYFRSRREFLFEAGGGLSGVALAYLLNQGNVAAAPDTCIAPEGTVTPFAPKPPHHKARATRVISLFMSGGVSQVDTFDPKPALQK
jgi:hypothetical protein